MHHKNDLTQITRADVDQEEIHTGAGGATTGLGVGWTRLRLDDKFLQHLHSCNPGMTWNKNREKRINIS